MKFFLHFSLKNLFVYLCFKICLRLGSLNFVVISGLIMVPCRSLLHIKQAVATRPPIIHAKNSLPWKYKYFFATETELIWLSILSSKVFIYRVKSKVLRLYCNDSRNKNVHVQIELFLYLINLHMPDRFTPHTLVAPKIADQR